MGEKKITKEKFTNLVNKATEFGKKTVADIQQSQKERELKKLHPIFEEDFEDWKNRLPNVIQIVDDAVRRNKVVCDGAIGWIEKQKGVEVFKLYDEYMHKCGIKFIPVAKCDSIYCVDPFDKHRFIDVEAAFERTTNEKISELERVTYCLGAKRCRVEIATMKSDAFGVGTSVGVSAQIPVEDDTDKNGKNKKQEYAKSDYSVSNNVGTSNYVSKSGKNWTYFEGNNTPTVPTLKWFKDDDAINGLIEMRCSGNNGIKSKVFEIKCSQAATMSSNTAAAVSGLLRGVKTSAKASVTTKQTQENNSVLIYEIEF
ncbi:MAG: hypothetical protein IKB54_07150 [Clostridia bacterium]|nr:hypothetical protein [Clostridia bacterium]